MSHIEPLTAEAGADTLDGILAELEHAQRLLKRIDRQLQRRRLRVISGGAEAARRSD